jgi:hypothetical protein
MPKSFDAITGTRFWYGQRFCTVLQKGAYRDDVLLNIFIIFLLLLLKMHEPLIFSLLLFS